ncbi:MAG: TIGR03435 family protein [Acidobacteriota bacterium]
MLLVSEFSLDAQLLHSKNPMPSFEVATIKPWSPPVIAPSVGPGDAQKPTKVAPVGAAAVTNPVHFIGPIGMLIEAAYGLPLQSGNRILGGPDWIRNGDRYEVIGKMDDVHYAAIQKMSAAEQKEQVLWMQQSLLAERFKFKAHIETTEMPRYALVLAKGGSKLEPAPADAKSQMSFRQNGPENEMRATAVSAEELAQSPFLKFDNRQIVDATGLQGRFNFTLKFRSNGNADAGGTGDAPELSTALQEQLGLKLVSENGQVEVLVIDHVERPSEN